MFGGQWRAIAKEVLDRTAIVAKFFCLVHVTNTYLFTPTLVYGPSMLPTLNARGDIVLSERFSHSLLRRSFTYGDVVLLRSPENPARIITKRVLAIEGDSISFVKNPFDGESSTTVLVPKGHIWVQGDNIYASKDSRHFGPVPYGLIQGKVFCKVWPFDEFGPLG